MADRFRDKYRIPSARARWWDYNKDAVYFVTINVDNLKNHYFGSITDGRLTLSRVGLNARDYWQKISEQFPFAYLGEYQVMPNHVHGIITINKQGCLQSETELSANSKSANKKTGGITGKHNPMIGNGLGRIIRWYKGRVTFESHQINPMFAWQARFHDYIIRDDKRFQQISQYIINNPANWKDDKFYS